jgi:Brp/Blh family beta-carotene 15,15'-monooxygenase
MAHGSLDVALSSQSNRSVFFGSYFARMLVSLATWVISPPIALVLFVIQSSDHFGEAQWIRLLRASRNSMAVRLRAWTWGLFASLFGVLYHGNESSPLIHALIGPMQMMDHITHTESKIAAYGLLLLGLWSSYSLDRYHRRVYGIPGTGLLSTAGLAISLMVLPLLPGFFCYFAFWHGWDSMRVQMKAKKWSMKEYAEKAAPYTFLAHLTLVAVFWFYKDVESPILFFKILFIAISALTAAHAPEMKRFLFADHDKKTQDHCN